LDAPAPRLARDEGGFVLPWMAIMLIVLIAMAGFGVDVWNWWYTSQKVQRAADAGALAGVPFMPGDLAGAQSTALAVVKQNGYQRANAVPGLKDNQLVVTVDDTVSNYFTSLLGLSTTNIARSATAEFNAPVAMGSPAGHLANDPENGAADQHWLNIGAPGVDKHTGDRFADYAFCGSNSFNCPGGKNGDYLDGTYVYTVDVPTVGGNGADIQVYDPELAVGNQNCDNFWLTSGPVSQIATLTPTYPDAAVRYAGGQGIYCTGDDNTNLGAGKNPQATAWLVRDGSTFPGQPLQNPVVPSGGPPGATACAHQFKGYVPTDGNYWFNLLNPANTSGTPAYDADFALAFHRWYPLCHVTKPGKYFIQVRSNVPYSSGLFNDVTTLEAKQNPPSDTSLAGQNRYSVRVIDSATKLVPVDAQTYALTRLPVYTNTLANFNPTFYLARLLPGGGSTGRTLRLTFYDIGDVSGTTQLDILPPDDSPQKASITCANWVFNGDPANPKPSGVSTTALPSGCRMSGITSGDYTSGTNGVLVDVNVKTPANYTCGAGLPKGVNDPNACWFKIKMTYSSGAQANDTTTWGATIGGDPVRLVK
jgi:hypothetical protein